MKNKNFQIHDTFCDKSVNKERATGTGERGTGTGDEEPAQGTRPWNEARETLRPYPNSVTGTWERGPAMCGHGGDE